MNDPVVTLHRPSVALDFESGTLEIRGHLTWDSGPHPEVLWVWAYFLNPGENVPGRSPASRSNPPIKLLHPLRQATAADIIARGHFHWWNNPDAPRDGYLAKITIAAASSEDAQVPVGKRDYSTVDAIPVLIRSLSGAEDPARERAPAFEYEVALSFAGENRQYVHQVATFLRQAGVSVFYDKFEEIELWGKNLVDHLADVYANRSRFVVLFVSADYARKVWPNHERKHALSRAVQQGLDNILPARFDDTELPGLPSSVGYVDLRVTPPERLAAMIQQKVRS